MKTRIQPGQTDMAAVTHSELLQQVFEKTVVSYPQKTALICDNKEITYEQLEARANQLAHYLKTQGIGRGDFVGIYLPHNAEVYVAILAVLKAGAAYLP